MITVRIFNIVTIIMTRSDSLLLYNRNITQIFFLCSTCSQLEPRDQPRVLHVHGTPRRRAPFLKLATLG